MFHILKISSFFFACHQTHANDFFLLQDDLADMEVMTSKEGNLALEEGTRERKKPVAKPTKYHYYPHNQHLYLLPECATQQVSHFSFLVLSLIIKAV